MVLHQKKITTVWIQELQVSVQHDCIQTTTVNMQLSQCQLLMQL